MMDTTLTNAQRKAMIEDMVAWAHVNLPTLVKYTVVGFLADYMHQTIDMEEDEQQPQPEVVANTPLATVEDCEDMLGQIAGIEGCHGGPTSITMTTKEAKAFVRTAKNAALLTQLANDPWVGSGDE